MTPIALPIPDLSRLEAELGHRFARPELLVVALTHRSQAYELAIETTGNPEDASHLDNERLEFLGDAVLGMVVAEGLFESLPDWQEGELTRLRAELVSRRNMAEVAQAIGLGAHLLLGKGEERSGGRRKAALLANAMEAVLAALFLDGGLDAVRRFLSERVLGEAADALARELRSGAALGDHKSALQKHLQAAHTATAVYTISDESGPDHRKRFQVELRLRQADGDLGPALATGVGGTRKKAEQEAARIALESLIRPAAEEAKR
jgi:ribonuclease-3